MLMLIITIVACLGILYIYYRYYLSLKKLNSFSKSLKDVNNIEQLESSYPKIKSISDDYKSSINIHINELPKTTKKAEDFYTYTKLFSVIGINMKSLNSAPGILSGLGVLGTFIGLTFSVATFDSQNSETIMQSIKVLLGGMGTAFATSIVGMVLSSIFIYKLKKAQNKFELYLEEKLKVLDDTNYISEVEIIRIQSQSQRQELYRIMEDVKSETLNLIDTYKTNHNDLVAKLTTYDDDDNELNPGNMFLNIMEESRKQSMALESFTTDLSNELNASLGKTMDTSIVPLINDLSASHKLFNQKLDALSTNIQSPATDLVSTVVTELKQSMSQIATEFKDSISGETLRNMDMLAENLTNASSMLQSVPQAMKEMGEGINQSFGNVKGIIEQMQSSMTEQQTGMIEKSRELNEGLASGMKGKFDEMNQLLQTTVQKINEQQSSVIEGQVKSTKEIERLVGLFNDGIKNMHDANTETGVTLTKIQRMITGMNESAGKIQEVSDLMNSISTTMMDGQKDMMKSYNDLQQGSQDAIDSLTETIDKSKAIMSEYQKEYPIIKEGLEDIFKEITSGLKEYSKAVRTTTGDALSEYSDALEKSTKGLQNIAEALNESAEELSDSVDKFRTRR